MAIRFRRTMKIAPGVRLNVGKKGVSARFGPKGAGYTVGTSGQRVSAGIPGTGLHATKKIDGAAHKGATTGRMSWGMILVVVAIIAALLIWLI